MAKRKTSGQLVGIVVECPYSHVTTLTGTGYSFRAHGGCGGHSYDEYCYCPPAEVTLSFSCKECEQSRKKDWHEVTLDY